MANPWAIVVAGRGDLQADEDRYIEGGPADAMFTHEAPYGTRLEAGLVWTSHWCTDGQDRTLNQRERIRRILA